MPIGSRKHDGEAYGSGTDAGPNDPLRDVLTSNSLDQTESPIGGDDAPEAAHSAEGAETAHRAPP
jgi:hypothetical protein